MTNKKTYDYYQHNGIHVAFLHVAVNLADLWKDEGAPNEVTIRKFAVGNVDLDKLKRVGNACFYHAHAPVRIDRIEKLHRSAIRLYLQPAGLVELLETDASHAINHDAVEVLIRKSTELISQSIAFIGEV